MKARGDNCLKETFSTHHKLADLLMNLQVAMQVCDIWECEKPTSEALSSVEPFCVDTMSFEQWLRFVMIERFKHLLATGAALPTRCHISPMAEDAFTRKSPDTIKHLLVCLDEIDLFLSSAS